MEEKQKKKERKRGQGRLKGLKIKIQKLIRDKRERDI